MNQNFSLLSSCLKTDTYLIEDNTKKTNLTTADNNFTNFSKLISIIKDNSKRSSAIEMSVKTIEESVKSHHYFFNPIDQFIGKALGILRPKKFKDITLELKKEDLQFKNLRNQKKQLERELIEGSRSSLHTSLINMVIDFAQSKRSFTDLFLLLPGLEENTEVCNQLKDLYETLSKACSNRYIPSSCVKQIVDFSSLSREEAINILKYKPNIADKKIDSDLWHSPYKEELVNLIEQYWNGNQTLSFKFKTGKSFQGTIKEYLAEGRPFVMSHFFPILKREVKETFPQIPEDKLNGLFGSILSIIEKKDCEAREQEQSKFPSGCNSVEDVINYVRNRCNQEPLASFFQITAGKIISKDHQSLSPMCLSHVIKEQKQHSITRFYNLLNYYTAFTNVVYLLGQIYKDKYELSEESVQQVVDSILENCHFELDDPHLRVKGTKTLSKEEVEQKGTIHLNAHREKNIMGREEEPIDLKDKQHVVDVLNLFSNAYGEEGKINNLQRSHTLPFPSCFAWKTEKEQEFIQAVLPNYSKNLNKNKLHFNQELFKKIVWTRVEHSEIEEIFKENFESYALTNQEPGEFLYQSLELIRKFYFRLFSETELLPDFINIYLDGVSEWREKNSFNSYKYQLATSLRSLIKRRVYCTKSDTAKALQPYFEKTFDEMITMKTKWSSGTATSNALPNLFRLTCLYQIEEGMRIALHDHKQALIDLFSRTLFA